MATIMLTIPATILLAIITIIVIEVLDDHQCHASTSCPPVHLIYKAIREQLIIPTHWTVNADKPMLPKVAEVVVE